MLPEAPPTNQPWWNEAVSVFAEVTGVMVVPIVAGVLGGRWLDQHFGTEPVFSLVATAAGIAVAALLLTPMARRYIAKAEAEAKKKLDAGNHIDSNSHGS